jgi:hypothetical protein
MVLLWLMEYIAIRTESARKDNHTRLLLSQCKPPSAFPHLLGQYEKWVRW